MLRRQRGGLRRRGRAAALCWGAGRATEAVRREGESVGVGAPQPPRRAGSRAGHRWGRAAAVPAPGAGPGWWARRLPLAPAGMQPARPAAAAKDAGGVRLHLPPLLGRFLSRSAEVVPPAKAALSGAERPRDAVVPLARLHPTALGKMLFSRSETRLAGTARGRIASPNTLLVRWESFPSGESPRLPMAGFVPGRSAGPPLTRSCGGLGLKQLG